ncbi:hypothetical protein CEUSTIGMA_g4695.t1 [Chlamydomonas eustigma]|uniref:Ribosome-binding factor A n=1 Tax=Chlamydomonas eustigma TaxID=1157962 RepID=A0A250X2T7_9CHLO|nr:hypothetical protein CEUSTIGMA_g4695.t1 [Chlamydomonas eustigma]|eukprot:GAX77249.1 hypothetical protein CEUSTIGMA_g4695.t1 [Chlamydomonas eustigma]
MLISRNLGQPLVSSSLNIATPVQANARLSKNNSFQLNLYRNVSCMAHPRRVAKVSSQIQREISDMLVHDSVLQNAMSPERSQGQNLQLSVVPSVTSVYVSNDLQVVKIYLSMYSDDFGKKRAMTNLKKLEPYVRREMGQRVPLRLTPEYRFEYDDAMDEMELIQQVIGEEDVARYRRELDAENGLLLDVDDDLEGEASTSYDGGDDDGFFGSDDVGEQEYLEISSSDVFNRPGPFDDLFEGDGDLLVQARASGPSYKANSSKGTGKGGRGRPWSKKNKSPKPKKNAENLDVDVSGSLVGGGDVGREISS